MHTHFEMRLSLVMEYLKGEDSLRKIACKNRIHFTTLYRWINAFKQKGEEGLMYEFNRGNPARKTEPEIERALLEIKEHDPGTTLKKAQALLGKKGWKISMKGIWSIWQKYGYCGFVKERISNDFTKSLFWQKSSLKKIGLLKREISFGHNVETGFTGMPLLPDECLSRSAPHKKPALRSQLMHLYYSFGKAPIKQVQKTARQLKQEFHKRGWKYSFLRAHFQEIFALDWLGRYYQAYREVKKYENEYKGLNDLGLKFALYMVKARCCMSLLKISEALRAIELCRGLLLGRKIQPLALMSDMATFYTRFGFFKAAQKWISKMASYEKIRDLGSYWMALYACQMADADYVKAAQSLEHTRHIWGHAARHDYLLACQALSNGEPEYAIERAIRSLNEAKKEGIISHLDSAIMVLSCAKSSLGKHEEGRRLIKPYLAVFKRSGSLIEYEKWQALITKNRFRKELDLLARFRLISSLNLLPKEIKIRDAEKTLKFILREKIRGIFFQFIFFYPAVLPQLLQGRVRFIFPSGFYQLPIVNQNVPSYEVRLLGPLKIKRNGKPLKGLYLLPKETGLLMSILTKREYELTIDDLCRNFWPDSAMKYAKRYLYNTLENLRRKLFLPRHLLYILNRRIVKKFHAITDRLRFQELAAQARALIKAEEYDLAFQKYNEAFKLFRGEPFKKNYDEWSLNMRHEILTQLETEAYNFAESYVARDNKKEAKKVLDKILNIIPDSTKIRELVKQI